jgi:DNA-binding response OmpR family regulator
MIMPDKKNTDKRSSNVEQGEGGYANCIVVIDDDRDLLKLMKTAFEARGFDVTAIATGKQALDYLLDEKMMQAVALVILDRILPDIEGLEILRQFSLQNRGKIPVIILSVLASEKDILLGYQAGAIEYITKPFNLSTLVETANTLIERIA